MTQVIALLAISIIMFFIGIMVHINWIQNLYCHDKYVQITCKESTKIVREVVSQNNKEKE